jgi:hypothetical protein
MAFSKAVWREVGGFDEAVTACIDFAFLEAVLRNHPLGVLDFPVAFWTWNEGNLSHDVHRRVFDVSTVMRRIDERLETESSELNAKMRAAMLDHCYYLVCRGEYHQAAMLWRDVGRRRGWSFAALRTLGKSFVKLGRRNIGVK